VRDLSCQTERWQYSTLCNAFLLSILKVIFGESAETLCAWMVISRTGQKRYKHLEKRAFWYVFTVQSLITKHLKPQRHGILKR
jgi:hypothetical protein